jgi:hypothetical protein
MRIIVHAGMPKTGTSAVQEYLHSVREPMLAQGIVYPDMQHPSHWRLAVALAADTLLETEENAGKDSRGYLTRRAANNDMDVEATLADTTRIIRETPADGTIILSHENFSAPQRAAQLVAFLREVAPAAEVEAIVYVRNPVALYPSGIQQAMKGKLGFTPPTRWTSSHHGRADGVCAAFGEAHTEVRAHDRAILVGGDIIEDFRDYAAGRIGVALPPAPKALSTNESMSAPVCALLLRWHQGPGGENMKAFSEMRRALMRFSRERRDPKLKLPAGWDAVIAQGNAADWNRTVVRMSYDEATKARLQLARPEDEVATLRVRDVRAWIGSGLDRAFITDFQAYLAEARDFRRGQVERWQTWLTAELARAD